MKFVNPKETLHCQRINYEKNWLLSCQQEKRGLKKKSPENQTGLQRETASYPPIPNPTKEKTSNEQRDKASEDARDKSKQVLGPSPQFVSDAGSLSTHCFIFAFICLELATLLSRPSSAATTCRLD